MISSGVLCSANKCLIFPIFIFPECTVPSYVPDPHSRALRSGSVSLPTPASELRITEMGISEHLPRTPTVGTWEYMEEKSCLVCSGPRCFRFLSWLLFFPTVSWASLDSPVRPPPPPYLNRARAMTRSSNRAAARDGAALGAGEKPSRVSSGPVLDLTSASSGWNSFRRDWCSTRSRCRAAAVARATSGAAGGRDRKQEHVGCLSAATVPREKPEAMGRGRGRGSRPSRTRGFRRTASRTCLRGTGSASWRRFRRRGAWWAPAGTFSTSRFAGVLRSNRRRRSSSASRIR